MPNHVSVLVQKEYTAHVSRRDKVVVAVFSNGVQMRVCPGIRCVSSFTLERDFGICHRNLREMIEGTPAKEDFVRLDIDLVEQAVLDPAVFWTSHGTHISTGSINRSNEDGSLVCDLTLVDIDIRIHRTIAAEEVSFLLGKSNIVELIIGAIPNADGSKSEAVMRVVALPVG